MTKYKVYETLARRGTAYIGYVMADSWEEADRLARYEFRNHCGRLRVKAAEPQVETPRRASAGQAGTDETNETLTGNKTMKYERLCKGCYKSKDGRIEINQLPDGDWAWAVDGIGYDAESTLKAAKNAAESAAA